MEAAFREGETMEIKCMTINPAILAAKHELEVLMGFMLTNEERKNAYDRMTKINQSTVLSMATIIDIVLGYVRSGRGSVEDALCYLERRYRLS